MKLKLVIVDFELPASFRRWVVRLGIPSAVLLAAAAAYGSVPHAWVDKELLTADHLNQNFSALDSRLGALEAAKLTFHTVTTCGQSGTYTACNCPTGEVAIGGGAGVLSAADRLVLSAPDAALTEWTVGCLNAANATTPCGLAFAICAKKGP